MARCSTSGLAAIGRDEPWWWDLSVLLGVTNRTDSPMFYRHRCSDDDTERRIYLRGPEHINTNKMYPCVAACHFTISLVTLLCQKSLKNPPMDDFSSVMKLQWTFDSGWTEFWVSKNERNLWLIWVMKDKNQIVLQLGSHLGWTFCFAGSLSCSLIKMFTKCAHWTSSHQISIWFLIQTWIKSDDAVVVFEFKHLLNYSLREGH